MKIVSVCQEMNWTYWDYMNQPSWFLDILENKLRVDYKKYIRSLQKATRQKKLNARY